MSNANDLEAVRKAAYAYYDAMQAGDGAATRAVFDVSARFWGVRDGAEVRRNLDEFVAMVETPAPASAPEMRIDFVDCAGDIAVAKLVDRFRGREYTDYLTFLRSDDGWKIVSKVFYAHPETERAA